MKARLGRRVLLRWPRLFVRVFSPDDAELGKLGEEVAARTLRGRGFRILARCLRTKGGEADLVVATGMVRAVVEVKTGRAASVPRPRAAIPPPDLDLRWRPGLRCDARRMRRLESVRKRLRADRIDLVEVFFLESRRRFRVLHHEDVGPEGIPRPAIGRSLERGPPEHR